ncbi:MAG: polysaccharide deacetylase family protein [Bacillota bacterium]|nr:polysaccharide deacetylase family protein [Bacillota bacterium]
MLRKGLVVFSIICILLTGCQNNDTRQVIRVEDSSQVPFKYIDGDRTFKLEDDTPYVSHTSVPSDNGQDQTVPAKKGELDNLLLDKLDNTKYSWGLVLNTKHQTPDFPSNAQKLSKKYNMVYLGDPKKKTVYLTFDEGYENGYTSKILDVLKQDNVKAIFFITGPYLQSEKNLVKRMLDEGHQVGDHTIDHPSLPDMDDKKLSYELKGLEDRFYADFGTNFKYMRPPEGAYSERVLEAADELGLKTVFWSFAYLDYDINNQKGADNAYNMVISHLHNGAVILLHAVSKDNADALDRIIKGIREQGYEISPFDL